MTTDRRARIAAACGVLFVVLELAGVAVASGAGRPTVTLADPLAKIVAAFAEPAATGVWVGAYLELLALGAFAGFTAWLFRGRGGGDAAARAGLVAAAAYVAVTAVGLVFGNVLEYRAGHGLGAQETLALFDVQTGLLTVSWGFAAGVLACAPVRGWLRRAGLVIAGLLLLAMAAPTAGASQFPLILFFIWVVAASVALARRHRPVAAGVAVAADPPGRTGAGGGPAAVRSRA